MMENLQQPPRWFAVAPWISEHDRISPILTILRNEVVKEQQVPFSTMAICSEARKEVLRTNVRFNTVFCMDMRWYDDESPPEYHLISCADTKWRPFYVNPQNDIFYIGNGSYPFHSVAHFATARRNPNQEDEKPPVTVDVDDVVLNQVRHLAAGFWILHGSAVDNKTEFFRDLIEFKGLKDFTVVLPEGRPRDVYPFYADGWFGTMQNPMAVKIEGLLRRWVARLFDDFWDLDWKRWDLDWKRPEIKVAFHIGEKEDFLGHTQSHHEGIPYADEAEFKTREDWEVNWSNKIWNAWKDELEQMADVEANVPRGGYVPSL